MKKQLLALAIGSLVAVPMTVLADTGPTLYGKFNVSYENVDDGNEDAWELRSNSSRIGVKGDLDLDFQSVKAIYQAEFEMQVDDGDKGGNVFSQRNIYGGFKHNTAGTLIAGRFDTPFKKAQGKVDQFGDLAADIGAVVGGEERVSNIIQYSTPKLGNVFTGNLALIPGEGSTRAGDVKDGPADAISSSLVFDNGTFYGALAYDSEVVTNVNDAEFAGFSEGADYTADGLRAVGMARISNFELGALVQMSETSDDIAGVSYEDTSYLVSGAINLNRWKLKAQYGLTDMDRSDDELTLLAVGADYKVGGSSKVFGYFANVEADNAALEDTNVGVGFEHKFSM